VGTYVNPREGTFSVEDSGLGRLRATIGVMSSLMDPIDDRRVLRVELIPGSGETVEFFVEGERADSLEYGGLVFQRR
jgi:hypothetical protein